MSGRESRDGSIDAEAEPEFRRRGQIAMNIRRVIFLLIGIALLGFILMEADLAQVQSQIRRVGWGVLLILGVYLVAFLLDTASWQVVLRQARPNLRWLYELWKIRLVGSAYNQIVPMGGVGGEPIKAVLLKKLCGIGYRDGAASLIITETINLFALVGFGFIGLMLVFRSGLLPPEYSVIATAGFGVFAVAIVLFYLVQILRVSSFAGRWLSRRAFGRRLAAAVPHIRAVDDRLAGFYLRRKGHMAGAFCLSFLHTVMGAVEVWLTFSLLGQNFSFLDAWAISALVEIVRVWTFLIPASIGAQEGSYVLAMGLITGQPTLGLSAALVRRFRDLVWIVLGVVVGWHYSLTPATVRKSALVNDHADP